MPYAADALNIIRMKAPELQPNQLFGLVQTKKTLANIISIDGGYDPILIQFLSPGMLILLFYFIYSFFFFTFFIFFFFSQQNDNGRFSTLSE